MDGQAERKKDEGARGLRDLRQWLQGARQLGLLQDVRGASWNLEIGALTELNLRSRRPRVLCFDEVEGYPRGYRVVTGATSSAPALGHTLHLPTDLSDRQLVNAVRERWPRWEKAAEAHPPVEVGDGPVLEHILSGKEVDLLRFPVPLWHEKDGGRYIGTGCQVITRHRETGSVNVGCYRVQAHERNLAGVFMAPSHHGLEDMALYHARGEACPVVVVAGHDPLFLIAAGLEIPRSVGELNFVGGVLGACVPCIRGEVTDLPIPAASEIALEGWIAPGQMREEGPFGEWHGHYTRPEARPVIQVERIYHRTDPILLGAPTGLAPNDVSYFRVIVKSAMFHNILEAAGVPGVQAVWSHPAGDSRMFHIVSLKQMFPGHAQQAGVIMAQLFHTGRYVVVVEEDIDPHDINQVLWAMCARSNPAEDVELQRRTLGSYGDPAIPQPHEAVTSRAVIVACRRYERLADYPEYAGLSPDLRERVLRRWRDVLDLPLTPGEAAL
ncbi:MAG: UbiD family decarboxylase [Candidatus Tectomicrobia bacterium]|nr:UbiD family decarboxylase [Candidatus Tectomicrobia bacterium]